MLLVKQRADQITKSEALIAWDICFLKFIVIFNRRDIVYK